MVSRHLHFAFLFEAVVGLLSLLTVVVAGKYGFFLLALLVICPLVLKREHDMTEQEVWRLYYYAFKVAVPLTLLCVLLTFLVLEVRWFDPLSFQRLNLLILPWFVVAHGFAGFVLSRTMR